MALGATHTLFSTGTFMSNEKIQELLVKLHEEIEATTIDADTRFLMQELDSDILDLLDSTSGTDDTKSVLESAKRLETRFSTSHPAAEHFIREIIDTLARMGV